MEQPQSASKGQPSGAWPRYTAAVFGFRNYWYPTLFSRQVGRKPTSVTLLGERILLVRHDGRVRALHDRCPHRGVPLSAGHQICPGLLTCAYHGWTYDLDTGELVAAITDGPDSPIVGKAVVKVRTYPVEERAGIVWVYVGDETAPPVEADIPEDMLRSDAVTRGITEVRPGNWRLAAENAVDEGHAKYLHRNTPYQMLREMPVWTRGVRMVPSEDGLWLQRFGEESVFQDVFPRIGRWPPRLHWWKSRNRGAIGLAGRMPAIFKVVQRGWIDFEMFVPVDADHHRVVLVAVKFATGLCRVLFALQWLAIRCFYYGMQNRREDQWMIGQMEIPPERLYRPDVSITAWRTWCHNHARGAEGKNGSTADTGAPDALPALS